jgi:hypothetical protein
VRSYAHKRRLQPKRDDLAKMILASRDGPPWSAMSSSGIRFGSALRHIDEPKRRLRCPD